jgi:hypothetical protein
LQNKTNEYKILVGNTERKRQLGRHKHRWDNIESYYRKAVRSFNYRNKSERTMPTSTHIFHVLTDRFWAGNNKSVSYTERRTRKNMDYENM